MVRLSWCWPILAGILILWGCGRQSNPLEHAQRLMEAEKYEAAAEVFRRTSDLEPQNSEARYLLGLCYLELGQPDQALLTLRDAIQLEPTARVKLAMGRTHHALGQRQRTLELFLAVLQDEKPEQWIDAIAGIVGDAHPVRQLTDNDVDDYDPVFTPDASQVAIASFRVQNAELYLLDLNGRVRSRITYTDGQNEGSPTFVPGNEWIICESASNENREAGLILQASGSTAQDDDLVAVHIYGREIEPAFPGSNKGSKPAVSPDGKLVAFQSVRDGNLEIYVASRETGEVQRLTDHPGDDGTPSFSPDGSKVVFVSSRDGNYELYTVSVQSGTLTRLTHNDVGDYDPSFSPDGNSIIYVSEAGRDMELHQLMLANGKSRQLTRGVGASVQPSFSPDGNSLVFVSDRSNFFQIYLMDLTHRPTVDELKDRILRELG